VHDITDALLHRWTSEEGAFPQLRTLSLIGCRFDSPLDDAHNGSATSCAPSAVSASTGTASALAASSAANPHRRIRSVARLAQLPALRALRMNTLDEIQRGALAHYLHDIATAIHHPLIRLIEVDSAMRHARAQLTVLTEVASAGASASSAQFAIFRGAGFVSELNIDDEPTDTRWHIDRRFRETFLEQR
jgi:hypothetical protein